MQTLEDKGHTFYLSVLFVLTVILYFTCSNTLSLTHPDEVFYIQTAKEMIQHKSYMTPLIFDSPQFEKPILSYWLFVLAIKTFGLSAFAGRFFPSLFGVIGVLATYWLSYLIFGKKKTAFMSALILSTSIIYVALSRAVLTDMIFSVLVLLSIAFFYWGIRDTKQYTKGIALGFIFSALAVLAKGVLGFIFPVGTIILYLAFTRELHLVRPKVFLISFIVFLIIALPWHIQMYVLYGQDFIKEYWDNVHVRRILEAEHRRLDHAYFYPMLMVVGIMPWFILWPAAVMRAFEAFKRNTEDKNPIIFLCVWISVVFIPMQAAHSKLASYILPLFPAIAILLGHGFESAMQKTSKAYLVLRIGGSVMGLLFLGMAVATVIAANMYKDFVPHPVMVYCASIFLTLLALSLFWVVYKNIVEKIRYILPSFVLGLLVFLFFGCPIAEPWVSCRNISQVFNKIDQSDSVVLASKFYVRGIRFYTDRKMAVIDINGEGFFSAHSIPFLNTEGMVVDFLNSQPVTYAVVKEGNVEDLERIVGQQKNLKLENLSGFGGKYILKITKS